jgi:hypothetical protein
VWPPFCISAKHTCYCKLLLQRPTTTYNTAQYGMKTTQDGLAFGASTIKETFIRKSFHKSNAQVQNPVIQNLIFSRAPLFNVNKDSKSLCPPWSDTNRLDIIQITRPQRWMILHVCA